MHLVIDIGNTSAKAGIFENGSLREKFYFNKLGIEEAEQLLSDFPVSRAILSNVAGANQALTEWLHGKTRLHLLNAASKLPFINAYETPETLGTDRIANVAGAAVIFADLNCLIIDAGTCLKLDLLDNLGVYQGGSISPGISLRFKAMNDHTSRLPLIRATSIPADFMGKSTESCMQAGVVQGMLAEINGLVQLYRERFQDLHVVLTGGDAGIFEPALKNSIFASPDLTLAGLNKILELNA